MGYFSVSVRWQGVGDGFIWACSGVYGPNDNNLRGQVWDELIGIQQLWDVPWCYMGDFNVVRFPSERLGGLCLTLAMENFSKFIEELNLIDLPLEGGSYTWSSGLDQPSMSRMNGEGSFQWCGDSPLKLTYPVVYGIASNKRASMASSLERLGTEE